MNSPFHRPSRVASTLGVVLLPVALAFASGAMAQTAGAAAPAAPAVSAPGATTGTPAPMAGKTARADAALLRDIAHANLAEIATGQLAAEKATDPKVKEFARTMVDDHTKALGDVTQLAQAKDVKLPTEPDVKHKAAMAKLKLMSGASFDRSYVKTAGVADHVATEKLLKKTQTGARDGEVKALADKMLPVVQQHLVHARELDGMKK
jgi:putative membrane protein